MTQLGFGVRVGIFRNHHNGSESVDRSGAVDTTMADLRLRHHFGDGFSAGLSIPIGLVRFDPTGAPIQRATGFGDIAVMGRYELLRGGGFRPSLALETELSLPTGQSSLIRGDIGAEAPPNLLSLGRGAFAGRVRLSYNQFLARRWALRAWTGAAAPMHANASGFRFGASIDGGIGAAFVVSKRITLAPQITSVYLGHSENSQNGTLINSGGLWVNGGFIAVWRPSDSLSVSASLQSPIYRDVNGEQITETVTGMLQLGLRFGAKEEVHDHGDEHGDHDEHGDEHKAHDGDEHKVHDGDEHKVHDGDEHKAHDGAEHKAHDGAEHKAHEGGDAHRDEPESKSGDVADLAIGGQSFNPDQAAVPGKITVVDYWAQWCGPCKPMTAALIELAARDSRVAIRKVEVPSFNTPVAKQHLSSAKGLPVVWLYDASGRRVKALEQERPDEVIKAVEDLLGTM